MFLLLLGVSVYYVGSVLPRLVEKDLELLEVEIVHPPILFNSNSK